MDENKKKYLKYGVIVAGLLITYILSTNVIPKIFVSMTKAAPATKVSVTDSFVLGEKILAKADGNDRCLINVFVLDKSGKGVAGKRVAIEGVEGIVPIKEVTDSQGKSSFAVISNVEGQFEIVATVEGIPLAGGVRVTFRN